GTGPRGTGRSPAQDRHLKEGGPRGKHGFTRGSEQKASDAHAASESAVPIISRPTSSAAPGPLETTPTSWPRDRTAIRSEISSSSSRSVEMTSAEPPPAASRRMRSRTVAVVLTANPYEGFGKENNLGQILRTR